MRILIGGFTGRSSDFNYCTYVFYPWRLGIFHTQVLMEAITEDDEGGNYWRWWGRQLLKMMMIRHVGNLMSWLNELACWFEIVHWRYEGGIQFWISRNLNVQSLKIAFIISNSKDPYAMQHYVTFYQGLYCLPKYTFRGFQNPKG